MAESSHFSRAALVFFDDEQDGQLPREDLLVQFTLGIQMRARENPQNHVLGTDAVLARTGHTS